jgi:hypothetical protein
MKNVTTDMNVTEVGKFVYHATLLCPSSCNVYHDARLYHTPIHLESDT